MYTRIIQISLLAGILVVCLGTSTVVGQVRNSATYSMEQDSINFGGGFSSSTNYTQESTFGEVATGRSSSTNFAVQAGYQQAGAVLLSLTAGANVVMTPDLGGVTGGESDGMTSVIATTNNNAGYQLTIAATDAPALRTATTSIADYTPAGGNADNTFTTSSSDAHFAFSPFGLDIVDRFKTNGTVCGAGSASSTACWDGLATSTAVIAQALASNLPNGATTSVYFKVGIGGTATQPPGVYVATTTITMSAL